MDANVWVPWIGAVVVAVISATPGLLGFFKGRDKSVADTAALYQNIANKAAERALDLQGQISRLEQRCDEQDAEIRLLEQERDDLKAWAEGLFKQVIELKGTPMPFKPRYQRGEDLRAEAEGAELRSAWQCLACGQNCTEKLSHARSETG